MMNRKYIPSIFPEQGLADPHALVENGTVYVICGHDKSPDTIDTWVMDKWVILESSDLLHWEKVGEILPTDTYIGDLPNCWAGNFAKKGNKYYWFFSNRNLSTGVLVADSPKGPFVDVLKRPLIDQTLCPHTSPYDPTVHQENEEDYYIIVGAGQYYMAKLSEDFLSLAEDLRHLEIYDKENNPVSTSDKSSFLKRNGMYYLIWGGKYAISKELYGPYLYQGEYNPNCSEHNDFFVFEDQWYMVSEHPEISHFYRGVALASIHFDDQGAMLNPQIKGMGEKEWLFTQSVMGFHPQEGEKLSLNHEKSQCLHGEVFAPQAYFESSIWCGVLFESETVLEISLKNNSEATLCQVAFAFPEEGEKNIFLNPQIDWEKQEHFHLNIQQNTKDFVTYTVKVNFTGKRLKRLAIAPLADVGQGEFFIDSIKIKKG